MAASRVCFRGPSLWLGLLCYVGCFGMLQDGELQPLNLAAEHHPAWVVGVAAKPRARLEPSWVVGVSRAARDRSVQPLLGEHPLRSSDQGVNAGKKDVGEPVEASGVGPMVEQLFTDMATLHKITGEVNPKTATVPSKLVDAALFEASTADDRVRKAQLTENEKDDQERISALAARKEQAKRRSAMQKQAENIIRSNDEAKMRKDQARDIKKGVKAAQLEVHEVVAAYKRSVMNVHLAKEKWSKSSDKAARTEAKLNSALAERLHVKNKLKQKDRAAAGLERATSRAKEEESNASNEADDLTKDALLTKSRFELRRKEETANRYRSKLVDVEKRVRLLKVQKDEDDETVAAASARIEIKSHEAKEMKDAADKAAYQSKDLENAADEIKQDERIRKIGSPEEGQEAIDTAKRASSFAANALDAVNKALAANQMQTLSTEANHEATAAALEAVKSHVSSKLLAAESMKATADGALALSHDAAKKAEAAAETAVSEAAAANTEKQKLETASDKAIANARNTAQIAKIALQNIDRAALGKPLLERPNGNSFHHSPKQPAPNIETPAAVLAAEETASHAAKVALYNTMEQVKEFNKRSRAASSLISEATGAAKELKQAKWAQDSARHGVVEAKEQKADLYRTLNRLKSQEGDAKQALVMLKAEDSKETSFQHRKTKIEAAEQRILQLKLDLRLHTRKMVRADAKIQQKEHKVKDASGEVTQAENENSIVQAAESSLHSKGLSAEAFTNAKRADMNYEIDRTAARVDMQQATDSSKLARKAISQEKIDPSSQKLIEAAKLAVLQSHETAKAAHDAMVKLHAAAKQEKVMDAEAEKVKHQMIKNAQALQAASKAQKGALKASQLTTTAAANEDREVKRAERAMDKATHAMERSGVNTNSMSLAKSFVEKALRGAKLANDRAKKASQNRQRAEAQAQNEMGRARDLVQKAKAIAMTAKEELKRATRAKHLSGTADAEESAAEDAVKKAEADIDSAEEKAVASANSIESESISSNSTNGTALVPSDVAPGLVKEIDDDLISQKPVQLTSPTLATSLSQRAERVAIQTALMSTSDSVRDASLEAMKQEHNVQQHQDLSTVKGERATQADLLVRAKKKMLEVMKTKVQDAKAAVRAATSEAAQKTRALKHWKASNSETTETSDQTTLETTYANKAVAVQTANKAYVNSAKSDLQIALAQQILASKEVDAQTVKAAEARALEHLAVSNTHRAIQKADIATRNFQILSANMIRTATTAADADAPKSDIQAASAEAERMAQGAITQLTDATANQRRVEAVAQKVAVVKWKLAQARSALRVAQQGEQSAQNDVNLALTSTAKKDADQKKRSWERVRSKRAAGYSKLLTELERVSFQEQVSTVQTNHLLDSHVTPEEAKAKVTALELKNLLGKVSNADARKTVVETEMNRLQKKLQKAIMKLDKIKVDTDQASGPDKYKAEMEGYVWTQKVKHIRIRVAHQLKKVKMARQQRAKYDIEQISTEDSPIEHSSIDSVRAQAALKMSKAAATKVDEYSQAIDKRKKVHAQQKLNSLLNNWKHAGKALDDVNSKPPAL